VKVARTGTSISIVSFKGKVDALLAKFEEFPIVKTLLAWGAICNLVPVPVAINIM
jgi:hypothetical protein